MKILKAIAAGLIVLILICLLPILVPAALVGNIQQIRQEKKLRQKFIGQFHGKQIGVLGYRKRDSQIQKIVDSLDKRLTKRLIILKNGDKTAGIEKTLLEDYKPDFESAGPLASFERYGDDPHHDYIDLRVVLLHPTEGGESCDLLTSRDELDTRRIDALNVDLREKIRRYVDLWDDFLGSDKRS